jgi:hypothetical protein
MPHLVATLRAVTRTVPPGQGHPQLEAYRALAAGAPCSEITVKKSVRAGATIEEARSLAAAHVTRAVTNDFDWRLREMFYDQTRLIPESGGTIGPLPDGTLIEVVGGIEAGNEMKRACPCIFASDWVRMTEQERCEAFNAARAAEEATT